MNYPLYQPFPNLFKRNIILNHATGNSGSYRKYKEDLMVTQLPCAFSWSYISVFDKILGSIPHTATEDVELFISLKHLYGAHSIKVILDGLKKYKATKPMKKECKTIIHRPTNKTVK